MTRAERKKERRKNRITFFLCITAAVLAVCAIQMRQGRNTADGGSVTSLQELKDASATQAQTDSTQDADGVHSVSALLIDAQSGEVKYQKSSEEQRAPAALTNIMTAVVVLDTVSDLQKQVTLNESMFQPLYDQNAAMVGFLPGEKVKVIDLLYGAILCSGAEAAEGLAEYTAGSGDAFVEKMNQKAEQLGMKDTHFANATGLPEEAHYSTAKDMSVLLQYALKNDTFRKIFTSKKYATAKTNRHADGITIKSTLFASLDTASFSGTEMLGGKTGHTDEAGLCLASIAKSGGREYILVTLGAEESHSATPYHLQDAKTIYTRYAAAAQ